MAYAVRSNVEDVFGVTNVTDWADIDNDGVAQTITDRIARALVVAEARVDALLYMGPYTIPFATAPTEIVDVTAKLAGVWLYEHRGMADFDPKTGESANKLAYIKRLAEETLKGVVEGSVRFILDEVEDVPAVVKD